jgi:hypothetical protein
MKIRLAASPPFDISSDSEDNILIVNSLVSSVLTDLVRAAAAMPSSIRFICKCAFESVTANFSDRKIGQRGVFMLFLFRVIFTLICQPQATDPPGLDLDLSVMSKVPKLLTAVFANDGRTEMPHLDALVDQHQETVEQIMSILTTCNEDMDVVEIPGFQDVIEAIDKIRERCAPSLRELTFFQQHPLEILRLFLLELVGVQCEGTEKDA